MERRERKIRRFLIWLVLLQFFNKRVGWEWLQALPGILWRLPFARLSLEQDCWFSLRSSGRHFWESSLDRSRVSRREYLALGVDLAVERRIVS